MPELADENLPITNQAVITNMLIRYVIALVAVLAPAIHAAETDWLLCGPSLPGSNGEASPVDPDSPIELTSDIAIFNEATGKAVLTGNVEVVRDRQYLSAERVYYSEQQKSVQARGGVTFSDNGLTVTGPEAEVHFEDDTAEFLQATYTYAPRHARGQAARVYRRSPQVIELEEATYTTCNPGKSDWIISADKVKLNRESGDGTARNVLLQFQSIPLFYSPWLPFPIDDRRKSGFLPPSIGTTSTSGLAISVPYYWNMAPNRDAEISPRYLSQRGLQLRSSFRYLYPFSKGKLNLEYIDDDQKGDNRFFVSLKDSNYFIPRLTTTIDYNKASDSDYFEDFGNSLSETSISHLQQKVEFRYRGGFWNVLTRAQKFQTIDLLINPLNRPYERLPQILLDGRLVDQAFGLGFELETEWVRFDRDAGVIGDRVDALFGIDRPFVQPGFFIKPSVSVRFSNYNLGNISEQGVDATPTRTVPILSLDSGLIFERRQGNGRMLQTLEPRLYYLYVPFRDQSGIPTFDTAELDFNFLRLFRDNRFIGGDRIGDAHQLTLALTSRLVDTQNGHETLSASVGQIFYFRDRKVTLPPRQTEETNSSDVVGELSFGIGDQWTVRGTTVFDPREGEQQRTTASLRFRAKDNRIFNLGYNFRRDDLDQTDLALAWPLGRRWHALGRWNFDLESGRNLEILGGLEYETCCWKARLVARRFINNADGDFNNSFEAQLVLKGLTALGSGLDDVLERGILGYEAED